MCYFWNSGWENIRGIKAFGYQKLCEVGIYQFNIGNAQAGKLMSKVIAEQMQK